MALPAASVQRAVLRHIGGGSSDQQDTSIHGGLACGGLSQSLTLKGELSVCSPLLTLKGMELLKWLSCAAVMSQEGPCNSCLSRLRLCLTKGTGEGHVQSLIADCTAFPLPPQGSEMRRELQG